MNKRSIFSTAAALLLIVGLSACSPSPSSSGSTASATPASTDPNTLTCLAGSEVSDMAPLLAQMKDETGVSLRLVSTGTLASVETLEANPTQYDCGWFSHNKYLLLNPTVKGLIKGSERIMMSPVILGVKAAKAKSLGWTSDGTTWADVAQAAKAGQFTFAMTSPASSNTGMSALIGVTAALSGSDSAITQASIKKVELSGFGKGQTLFSDSSGWLTTAFVKSLADPKGPDGMINYESELLKVNARNNANLTLIYPKEGIVTADYPLMLFNANKRGAFDKVVAFLRKDTSQRWIMQNTFRRPISPSVPADAAMFGQHLLVDTPFPGSLDVMDALLLSYLDKQRLPGHVYFVLDTSGSMGENGGIQQLRQALVNLAGNDVSLSGRFARFRQREKITVIEFASGTKSSRVFTMGPDEASMKSTLQDFSTYSTHLQADGGTAMFNAVAQALVLAHNDAQTDPGYLPSIVVMTDGQSNKGLSPDEFSSFYQQLPQDSKHVRIFGVLFGSDASKDQISLLSTLTGGAVFDGSRSLSSVFKNIRGYQ